MDPTVCVSVLHIAINPTNMAEPTEVPFWLWTPVGPRVNSNRAYINPCKDRSQYKCFKYLLTKLSNNINVFVIFKWSLTLAIFETISETTREILEN